VNGVSGNLEKGYALRLFRVHFRRPLQVTVRPMLRDRCPICPVCLSSL